MLMLFAGALWSSQLGYAQSTPEPPLREVTAVIPRHFPPQYIVNDAGDPDGFAIEVMEEIAALANLKITYLVEDSWDDVSAALRSGRADLIPNNGVILERQAAFAFTAPVETFAVSIFVREATTDIETEADLAGRRVAAVETNIGVNLLQEREDINSVVFGDVHEALFQLLAGHVDALVYPQPTLLSITRSAGIEDQIKVVGGPLVEIKRAIAVRKDDTELLARLNEAVEQFVGTEGYKQIYVKWYGQPELFWTPARVAWAMGGLVLLVLVVMAAWRYRSVVTLNRDLVKNIEQRTQAEEALRESERRYRNLVESSPETIGIQAERRVVYLNPAGLKMFGATSPDEIIGKSMSDLIHPDQYNLILERSAQSEVGETDSLITLKCIRVDGELFDFEGVLLPTVFDDKPAVQFVGRDMTTQKRLEEQLRQVQKMEAIGRLAGGIAHDLNNILVPIIGYTDLALMQLLPENKLYADLSKVRRSAERAAELTKQILAYSRKQLLQLTPLDLNEVITGIQQMVERLIEEDIELQTDLHPSLYRIKADKSQMEQIIMNLAINARDAMPDGGKLTIETDNVYLDEAYIKKHVQVEEGFYVMVTVSDTGQGMDAETRTQIFEPFFTTKEIDKGTGLGLATVHGIVKQHRGNICVYSEINKGTIFKIYFPKAEKQQAVGAGVTVEEASLQGKETLLVVEDEQLVRELVCESLEAYGYHVLQASDPENGLRLASKYDKTIDLLLTDVMMPKMSGRQLFETLKKTQPNVQIIYMFGDSDSVMVQQNDLNTNGPFLQKPFSIRKLIETVKQVLTTRA